MFGYDWPRLHAALNDLPTALLVGAVFFDLLAAATRKAGLRVVSFWTLILGAVGGALAVLSGLQAEEHIAHGDAVHRVMETHEELALITLGVFAVLALWRILRERKMGGGERALVLLTSLGGVAVLTATAVYGGTLVFDHAAGIPTTVLQGEIGQRAAGHHHAPGEEHGDEAHEDGGEPHAHDAAVAGDSAASPDGHVDPPGTPPHSHARRDTAGHTHPPGTPAHEH